VESEPFRVLVLAAPAAEKLEPHLAAELRRRNVSDADGLAGQLVDRLVHHQRAGHDGTPAPLPLSLLGPLVRVVHRRSLEELAALGAGDLIAEYVGFLTGPRKDRGLPPAHEYAVKEPVLAVLAKELTDRRVEELATSELMALPDRDHQVWSGLIDDLKVDGVLERDPVMGRDPPVGFTSPVLREYFAARWLSRQSPDEAVRRVADVHWHEPVRLMITFADGAVAPVPALLAAALEHDPALAVAFMRAFPRPPANASELLEPILRTGWLVSATSEEERHRRTAALADLGWADVRRFLGSAVADPIAPASSRAAGLRALERMMRRGGDRTHEALRNAVAGAIHDDVPEELQVAAMGVLRHTGMRHSLLRVAELIHPDRPWPVTEAARGVLRAQDIDLTEGVRRRWAASCEGRLEENERELGRPQPFAKQLWLIEERRHLLSELAEEGRRNILLAHRFRFGMQEHVESLVDLPAPDPVEITPDLPPGTLLAAASGVTELDAVRDAARLDAVEAAVAVLAERLPTDDRGAASGPGPLEPVAALVAAVFAIDRPRGVRMALETARTLEDRDVALRRAWPWTEVFARARGGPSDMDALLDAGRADLAIYGWSQYGFLVDAAPGPEHRPSRSGRERLLARRPGPAALRDRWRYVLAAATAGLSEALEEAIELAAVPGFGTEPYPLATGVYGVIEDTELAGALAAAGCLARLSRLRGESAGVDRAGTMLTEFPVEDLHPSVAAGRLAGLAYLGEWPEVLRGCTRDDPRLRQIAAKAVRWWAPSDRAGEIARWIDEHLRHTEPPEHVRVLLDELRRDRERVAGLRGGGT
jgi:hypothetical protein